MKRKFEMEIDPHDYADRKFVLGTHDPAAVFLIENWVKAGDVCIDIGAQKGYITLHLASQVGRNGHVFAFEPDPNVLSCLRNNISRNMTKNVHVYEYAVGQWSGVSKLYLSSQPGWSSQFPNDIAAQTISAEIEIPVRSIDQLIDQGEFALDCAKLSFIKIDCEGAEPFALNGMIRVLSFGSPLLWIEINASSLHAAGSSPHALQDILTHLGYSLYLPKYRRSRLGWRHLSLDALNDIPDSVPGAFDIAALKHNDITARAISKNISIRSDDSGAERNA